MTSAPLPAPEAYALWAPTYEVENGVTLADRLAVAALGPSRFERLLDAGCGTGRRLPPEGFTVGADLVFEMLVAGRKPQRIVLADVRALPLPPESFDLVWCRLALGHVRDAERAYRELARVCRSPGRVVVTDVHPGMLAAGFTRSFTDASGRRQVVEHHVHDHPAAAAAAGLSLLSSRVVCVGPDLRPAFEAADYLDAYERRLGMPVVAGFCFVKNGRDAP